MVKEIRQNTNNFSNALTDLREFFIARNYPKAVINYAFDEVCKLSQSETLVPSSNIIPFVIEYNPSLPNIGYIINRYWDLLQLSSNSSVKELHKYKPVMAYKRPRNIKDILVKSKFSGPSDFKFFSSKCKRPRYTHCSRIVESDHFLSSQKCISFKLNYDTNCTTRNVIYLISCKKCDKQTSQQVSKRMNSHKFDITNFKDPDFSTHVPTHFNAEDHSFSDFSFMPIDIVSDDMERLDPQTRNKVSQRTKYKVDIQC